MTEQKRRIFRQQALDRLSNPEQLDKLMQVVSPKDWLPLSALAVFGILGISWSIFGKIPITVTGKGVLINPHRVVDLQSPITGQLQSLNIRSGQCVKKDEILGVINPADKKQQLQQLQDKLAQLQQQTGKTTLVRQQRTQLETSAIIAQRTSLKERLQDTQKLTPRIKDEGLNSISKQRISFQQKLKDTEELIPILEKRLTNQRELQKEGAISQEQVLQAEKEYRQTRQNISETKAQLQQLRVQETELQQKYQENLNNINQINAELEKLGTQNKQLEQNNLETTNKF